MSNLTDLDLAGLGDPDYELPMGPRITLGLQHVLAMFASNVTPSIILAGAVGFAFGSADMIFLIQMAMLFAGVATLFQTIGFGPVSARLPVMQGTSFAFVPIMIGVVRSSGMAALIRSVIVAGIFHAILGSFIGRLRHWFPPLVSGMVITTIGLYLILVGIRCATGEAADFQINNPNWSDFSHWSFALVVIIVALGCKFFTRRLTSSATVLIGLFAGYLVGIAKGGAGREFNDRELAGGTYADGLGSAHAGIFGGLPNTSFSQNVGIVSMAGVMSHRVVAIGAIFLIICGFIPKSGAVVSSMPLKVLGGAVILMFGMVVSAGVSMLSTLEWSRHNMMILATSMSVGLGLQAVPKSMRHLPDTLGMLVTLGLLPVAVLAVVMNLLLPADDD